MGKKLAIALMIVFGLRALCSHDEPAGQRDGRNGRHGRDGRHESALRIATFNIENYPQSARQRRGAFALLADLQLDAVGVQEITRPEAFARHAQKALGEHWQFAFCTDCPIQRVGVLYDSERLNLLSTHTHRDTDVYRGAKPAFEARLQSRWDGQRLRIVVVHLKSGGDHADTRRLQLRGLRAVLERTMDSGEQVIALGDFNATSDADRRELADLARATDMIWTTRDLPCTSYWARRDECRGTPLDHILSSVALTDVAARGPCESIGCSPGKSCPLFHREVSDHCPVTAVLE